MRLEAASVCQLRCPDCPTTQGVIRDHIGGSLLTFESFRRVVDDNPHVCDIELSNWGEIFLNHELAAIIEYAYRRGVALRADNGVNLNTVSDEVLEALVRYKFRSLRCSIDGASPETYAIYRRRGDFDRVIRNVRAINAHKRRYRSMYPYLTWQFVVFPHNAHEIDAARALAAALDMGFRLKLSWGAEHGELPANVAAVREEVGAANVGEYRERFGKPYMADVYCGQLWNRPQVHTDGRVLGCCVNYWGDFGNAFEAGLAPILDGERMRHARAMLEGKAAPRADIPCTRCHVYADLERSRAWLDGAQLASTSWRLRLRRNRLANHVINRCVSRPVYAVLEWIGVRAGLVRAEPEAP